MSKGLLIVALCVALVACGGAPQKHGPSDVEDLVFSAPLDTPLVVQIGDEIFVSGKALTLGTLEMSEGITSKMPGAYSVDFDFSIDKTILVQEFDRGSHRYFAPRRKTEAQHIEEGRWLLRETVWASGSRWTQVNANG